MKKLMVMFVIVALFMTGCSDPNAQKDTIVGYWYVEKGVDAGTYLFFREDGMVIRFNEEVTGYLAYGLSRDTTGKIVSDKNWYKQGEDYYLRSSTDEWLVETFGYDEFEDVIVELNDTGFVYDENECRKLMVEEEISFDEIHCVVENDHCVLSDVIY